MKLSLPWNTTSLADGIGILGATLCALHCVGFPILLVLGSVLPASFLSGEAFHQAMLWLVVPAAVIAFSFGCRVHRDRWVLILGVIGVVGLVASGTVLHDVLGETGETVGTLLSAAILITAHVRNHRLCRAAACRHEDAEEAPSGAA
ncbi:MAG: MerC domain-containing protein [Acidobacteriota bacterium]